MYCIETFYFLHDFATVYLDRVIPPCSVTLYGLLFTFNHRDGVAKRSCVYVHKARSLAARPKVAQLG